MKEITVAVAGQPNAGKSTIFNMLTGSRQHVANYPGVTVEKRTGKYVYRGTTVTLVDLPGTYSLTSYSKEEKIARDYLLHEKPHLILNIVDAANLERNLYLTFQLAEMEMPMVVALNMIDVAEDHGLAVNADIIASFLGMPVIPTVGKKKKGGDELREAIRAASIDNHSPYENGQGIGADSDAPGWKTAFRVDYGEALEACLAPLEERLRKDMRISPRYPARWLAVKLIENDSQARRLVLNVQEGGH